MPGRLVEFPAPAVLAFRMTIQHVCALQRVARSRARCGTSLLDFPDGAAWQVPRGSERTAGAGASAHFAAGRRAIDLGTCSLGWGSLGGGRLSGRVARQISPAPRCGFNNDGERPETGAESVRRTGRLLLSPGLRVQHSPLLACAASGPGGNGRD